MSFILYVFMNKRHMGSKLIGLAVFLPILFAIVFAASYSACDPGDEQCKRDFDILRSGQVNAVVDKSNERSFFGAFLDIILGRNKENQAKAEKQQPLQLSESHLRVLEDDMKEVEMRETELRQRRSELHRYIKETSSFGDNERNSVVDQLVEDELERLDILDWRLTRIRKRLQSTIQAAKEYLEKNEMK